MQIKTEAAVNAARRCGDRQASRDEAIIHLLHLLSGIDDEADMEIVRIGGSDVLVEIAEDKRKAALAFQHGQRVAAFGLQAAKAEEGFVEGDGVRKMGYAEIEMIEFQNRMLLDDMC